MYWSVVENRWIMFSIVFFDKEPLNTFTMPNSLQGIVRTTIGIIDNKEHYDKGITYLEELSKPKEERNQELLDSLFTYLSSTPQNKEVSKNNAKED